MLKRFYHWLRALEWYEVIATLCAFYIMISDAVWGVACGVVLLFPIHVNAIRITGYTKKCTRSPNPVGGRETAKADWER